MYRCRKEDDQKTERRKSHQVKTTINPTANTTTRPTSITEGRQSTNKVILNTPQITAGTKRPSKRTELPKSRRQGRRPKYGAKASTTKYNAHQERQEESTGYALAETAARTFNGVREWLITTQGRDETTEEPELRAVNGHTGRSSQEID